MVSYVAAGEKRPGEKKPAIRPRRRAKSPLVILHTTILKYWHILHFNLRFLLYLHDLS